MEKIMLPFKLEDFNKDYLENSLEQYADAYDCPMARAMKRYFNNTKYLGGIIGVIYSRLYDRAFTYDDHLWNLDTSKEVFKKLKSGGEFILELTKCQ